MESDIERRLILAILGRTAPDAAREVMGIVQAAFNAGLERAAVIAEGYDDKRSLMTGVGIAVAAIRAEKEKPQ